MSRLTRLYGWILHLYPPRFRTEFGPEMQSVFTAAAAEAHHEGSGTLWRWSFRELRQLPLSLLEQWWFALTQGRNSMISFTKSAARLASDAKPAPWGASILAGLPYLLFALSKDLPYILNQAIHLDTHPLMVTLARGLLAFPLTRWLLLISAPLSYWSTPRVLYTLSEWLFLLLVAAMLLVAWRKSWPRWFASWAGFGMVALILGLLNLRVMYEVMFLEAAIPLLWFVLCLYLYGRLAARDLFTGLVAVLPVFPMLTWWLAADGILGMVPEIQAYLLGAAVISLAVVAAYRKGSLAWMLLALTVAIPLGGAYLSYLGVYFSNMPNPPEPTVSQVVIGLLGNFLGLLIVSAPVWGVFLYKSIRGRRAAG